MQRTKRRFFPVVDKEKQYAFLAIILIYMMIIVGVLALSLFLPDVIKLSDKTVSPEIRGVAAEKMLLLHSRVWPGIIAIIIIIGIHWFRVFHRIVGPLFRFQKAYEQIGNGDLSIRIRLRKKDYLHPEKDALNHMIEGLVDKVKPVQQIGNDLLDSVHKLEDAIQKQVSRDAIEGILREHRTHCETLVRMVGRFRV
jgi:methyl-accepting chemotaxis protein